MEYARLGGTGLKVSRICLGCMSYGDPDRVGPDGSRRFEWALREDQARPFFARALELGINFFDTANVYSFGASLRRLGTDYVDLYQIHLDALDACVRAGKVRTARRSAR